MIPKQAYKQLVLSMLALMIAMSISRFAYTPILPFMQQDTSMNNQNAGLLATFNYLGYLMGAIIPMFITIKSKVFDLKLYVMINVISVILMGFSEHFSYLVSSANNCRHNEWYDLCCSIKCGVRSIKNG